MLRIAIRCYRCLDPFLEHRAPFHLFSRNRRLLPNSHTPGARMGLRFLLQLPSEPNPAPFGLGRRGKIEKLCRVKQELCKAKVLARCAGRQLDVPASTPLRTWPAQITLFVRYYLVPRPQHAVLSVDTPNPAAIRSELHKAKRAGEPSSASLR